MWTALRDAAAVIVPIAGAGVLLTGAFAHPDATTLDDGAAPHLTAVNQLHIPSAPGQSTTATFTIDNPAATARTSHLTLHAANTGAGDLVRYLHYTEWTPTDGTCTAPPDGSAPSGPDGAVTDVTVAAGSSATVCVSLTLDRSAGNDVQGAGATVSLTAQTA